MSIFRESEHTLGAFVHAVMAIHNEAVAKDFWQGYIQWMGNTYPETDAQNVCRSNIGWCFGEGMPEKDRAMWIRVCDASHPVFGQAKVTPKQAFAAGLELGGKQRG